MKVVLIGYMGSGKSTIGKLMSKQLELSYYDLDAYIETAEQATIADIFEAKGEIYFRRLEHQYLLELLESQSDLILATGGGTPCYSGNMQAMLAHSVAVIYLKLSIPKLIERLHSEKQQRPLIAHLEDADLPEFIGKHLFERNTYYSLATHTVMADNKTPDEVTSEILALLV